MARHIKNQKRKRHGVSFWDHEYTSPDHLSLSDEVSGDLLKFLRWLERQSKRRVVNPTSSVIDVGCGNGRNLIYLANTYGMHGVGYDSSAAAIKAAKHLAAGTNLKFVVRSMAGPLDLEDESQMLALDMMSSHFLAAADRTQLRDELYRILKPGGYLFMKTFLKDGDLHTARLLEEHPGPEAGSYIHPVIGVPEYVYGEDELRAFLESHFTIQNVYISHKHVSRGKAKKRRTISIYAQKPPF